MSPSDRDEATPESAIDCGVENTICLDARELASVIVLQTAMAGAREVEIPRLLVSARQTEETRVSARSAAALGVEQVGSYA